MIREALETHLSVMSDRLPVVWEGRKPTAGFDANNPHMKAFFMPNDNKSLGLSEKTTLLTGIFQVNLCYPSGSSAPLIEAQGRAIAQHFKNQILIRDGVKVRIRGLPSVAAPVGVSPVVVPVTIRYQSINSERA